MSVDKEEIKVGNTTMWAQTVPVNTVFDACYLQPNDEWYKENGMCGETFKVIEVDGYYIVSRDRFALNTLFDTEFKCFLSKKDVKSYLELFGVEFDDDDEEEDRQDSERDWE